MPLHVQCALVGRLFTLSLQDNNKTLDVSSANMHVLCIKHTIFEVPEKNTNTLVSPSQGRGLLRKDYSTPKRNACEA